MLSKALGVAGGGLAAVVALQGAQWTVLSLVALPRPRLARRPLPLSLGRRLVVVVPAQNEARLLPACLDSLAAATYRPRPEVLVVADNCSDDTAAIARSRGATVIERNDPGATGKGFALEFAIAVLAARTEPPEAVLFVDADSEVSAGFFIAVDDALAAGAEAVQVLYRAPAGEGHLLALRRLGLSLLHYARPLGERRLGLGSVLRGNGMGFPWASVRAGLGALGQAEDAAMTLALAERGIAVAFVPDATVTGHMAPSYRSAAVQDRRWEAGRAALAARGFRVAIQAARRGRWDLAHVAHEVAAPPLTMVVVVAAGCGLIGIAGIGPLPLMLAAPGLVALSVAIGFLAARTPWSDLRSLLAAPRFVAHKVHVYGDVFIGGKATGWERTARE